MYSNIIFCNKIPNHIRQPKTLDIRSRGPYPANVLSNLSDTEFVFDGIKVKSVEGFLQSLKIMDSAKQQKVCAMSGVDAKKLSKQFRQSRKDALYFWNGKSFKRDSDEFKTLLNDVIKTFKESGKKFPFEYQGRKINSINVFLTALREPNTAKQTKLMQMSVTEMKQAAKTIDFRFAPRTLYWQGETFSRESTKYKDLLTHLYKARLKKDLNFREALQASQNMILTHSKGKNRTDATILTTNEFLGVLETLRQKLKMYFPE